MNIKKTLCIIILMSLTAGCNNNMITSSTNKSTNKDSTVSNKINYDEIYGFKIEKSKLVDKVKASWLLQLIANDTGNPYENTFLNEPNPATSMPLKFVEKFESDDDTSPEYTWMHMMEVNGVNDVSYYDMREEWLQHFDNYVYLTNLQAKTNFKKGLLPPDTGSKENNLYYDQIDPQIECEIFGMISAMQPLNASNRSKYYMSVVTNEEYISLSNFLSTLVSISFGCDNVNDAITKTIEFYNDDSILAVQVVKELQTWCQDATDWREVRAKIVEKYSSAWTGNINNFSMTIMALLMGNNSFEKTTEIAVLAGLDCDCTAATAGAIMGAILGYESLSNEIKDNAASIYLNKNRRGLEDTSIDELTNRTVSLFEENVIDRGGVLYNSTYYFNDTNFEIVKNNKYYFEKISDDKITYSGFELVENEEAHNGKEFTSRSKDSTWSATFTGATIEIYAHRTYDSGVIDIFIDDKLYMEYNLKSALYEKSIMANSIAAYQEKLVRIPLEYGEHKIEIKTKKANFLHAIDYVQVDIGKDKFTSNENNFAPIGQIVASSFNSTVSHGSGTLLSLNDGIINKESNAKEYYSSYGIDFNESVYYGYKWDDVIEINQLILTMGLRTNNGGYFNDLKVQTLINNEWVDIETDKESYNFKDTESYQTIEFNFDKVKVNGIRIIGTPAGGNKFITISELEVYCKGV